MGQSTDAILAFGIELEEDGSFPWGEDEFDTWWAGKKGVSHPTGPYHGNELVYREYWKRKGELEKECPAELIRHCHCECPMYVLAMRGTVLRASRGCPKRVGFPVVDEAKRVDFVQFLLDNKIPFEGGLGWLLFSDWS